MLETFISIGELALILGLSTKTLRRWDQAGSLAPACRTVGGHRRYDLTVARQTMGLEPAPCQEGKTIAYARVSSHDQKAQLETQALRLEQHCAAQGWADSFEVVKDLGSGMNCHKKGLVYLMKELLGRRVTRLVLVTKDRLLRFGADLLLNICKFLGVEVLILDEVTKLPVEQEMVNDMISIMTVFTSRVYGSRSRKNLRAVAAQAVS